MKKFLLFVIVCIVSITSCHRNSIEETTNTTTIVDVHDNAISYMNEQLNNGNDLLTAVNNCIGSIKQSPDVKNAYIQDDNIIIVYNSGLTSIITIIDGVKESEEKHISSPNVDKFNSKKYDKSNNGFDLITNHDVLIWEPFFDGFGLETYTGDFVQSVFENSSLDFNVTHLTGNQCTLTSLNNLTQYGFVYIKSHGGAKTENGEDIAWIVTGEKIPMDIDLPPRGSKEKIPVTIAEVTYGFNSEIVRLDTHGDLFWGVTNKYITNHVNGRFNSPAIVFVEACCSYSNEALRNAFIEDKKASAYLGYKNPKTMSFGLNMAMQFTQNMLDSKLDAHQAYNSIVGTHDNSWFGLLLSITGNGTKFLYSSAKNVNPTYFGSKGYVECPNLNKRWPLDQSSFSVKDSYSLLRLRGDSVRIDIKLSKMNNMIEGTYNHFIINNADDDIDFFYYYSYPMHFAAGCNYFDAYSGIITYSPFEYACIENGQLICQKQNNQNKYTFNFISSNGYSYQGEYLESENNK